MAASQTKKKPAKRNSPGRTTSSARKRASSSKSGRSTGKKAASATVTVDRRQTKDRRKSAAGGSARASGSGTVEKPERRKPVNRRRQIDPTTCERDYTEEEIEFMNALEVYKRKSGRMFPTCSEVLEVIKDLGYVKSASLESPRAGNDQFEHDQAPGA